VVASMIVITIDWRLFIGAAGYLAAFLVAINAPDYRYHLMSASNFIVMLNCIVVWRPPAMFRPAAGQTPGDPKRIE